MTDDLEQQLGVRLTALAERAPSQAVTRSGVARRVRQRAVRRRAALCAGDVAFAGAVAGAFALRPSSSSHVTAGGPTTTTAERDLPLATTVGERVPRLGLADPSVQITGVDGPIATKEPILSEVHEQLWSDNDELSGRRLVVTIGGPAADTLNRTTTPITVQGRLAQLAAADQPASLADHSYGSALFGTLADGRTFAIQSYGVDDTELLAFTETLRPRVVSAPVTTIASSEENVLLDGTPPLGMQMVRQGTITAQRFLESRYDGHPVKQVTLECTGIGCYEGYRTSRMRYVHAAAVTVRHQPAIVASEDAKQWRVVFNERGLWTYEVTIDATDAAGAVQLVNEQVVDLSDDAWAALAARVTPASSPSPANATAGATPAGSLTTAPLSTTTKP